MEAVTLALALIGSGLVLSFRPLRGLVVYLAILCWYSAWQPIVVGGVNLTAPRIVILVLLFRCLGDKELRLRFRWVPADALSILLVVGEVAAGVFTSPLDALLQNRTGAFFDTLLVYSCVRLTVKSRGDVAYLLCWLLIIAAPLATLGAYQSVTGSNPWGVLVKRGAPFEGVQAITERAVRSQRYGLFRASVNFPYPITFGFFFALVGVGGVGLWHAAGRRQRWLVSGGCGLAGIGLLSSVSSGPVMAGATAALVLALWPLRRYWKIGLAAIVAAVLAVEVISNRHWYDVMAWYLTFNRETAQYRIDLVEEALTTGMAGHWLLGFGLMTPTTMHKVVSHWRHTDIANHYIYQVMRFGLLGLVPWVMFVWASLRRLRLAYDWTPNKGDRWLLWCLGAAAAGVLSSMWSACWEGPAYRAFFALLGLSASAPGIVRAPETAAAGADTAGFLAGRATLAEVWRAPA